RAAAQPHQPAGGQAEGQALAQEAARAPGHPALAETLYRISGYDNVNGIGPNPSAAVDRGHDSCFRLQRRGRPRPLSFMLGLRGGPRMGWGPFDGGATVGQRGSEDGAIVRDDEHDLGARITLERGCAHCPVAVTCGIYGWFFHTRFLGSEAEAEFDR